MDLTDKKLTTLMLVAEIQKLPKDKIERQYNLEYRQGYQQAIEDVLNLVDGILP